MMQPPFASTNQSPRIKHIEAIAFHNAAGRIQHMHHYIVLEGAEPRPYKTMLNEVMADALALGTDVSKLRVLHVKKPFNLGAQHKVDVKKGLLVELKSPALSFGPPVTRKKRKR